MWSLIADVDAVLVHFPKVAHDFATLFDAFSKSHALTSALPANDPPSKARGRKIDAVTTPAAGPTSKSQKPSTQPDIAQPLPGAATPNPSSDEHRKRLLPQLMSVHVKL